MKEFYHVARKEISQMKHFELSLNDWFIENKDLYIAEDFKILKANLYPDGISKHGEIYLHHLFELTDTTKNSEFTHFAIETIFELTRRLKFPERQSRFVSTFGCLTIEDARRIRSDIFENSGSIYKVSCNNYFKADMSLLVLRGSIIGMEIIAEKYWSGQSSKNPFWEVLMQNPVTIIEKIE